MSISFLPFRSALRQEINNLSKIKLNFRDEKSDLEKIVTFAKSFFEEFQANEKVDFSEHMELKALFEEIKNKYLSLSSDSYVIEDKEKAAELLQKLQLKEAELKEKVSLLSNKVDHESQELMAFYNRLLEIIKKLGEIALTPLQNIR